MTETRIDIGDGNLHLVHTQGEFWSEGIDSLSFTYTEHTADYRSPDKNRHLTVTKEVAEKIIQALNAYFGLGYTKSAAIVLTDALEASRAVMCCGEYAKCSRPCTPRGEWLAKERIKNEASEPVAWIPAVREDHFYHDHRSITAYRSPVPGWTALYAHPAVKSDALVNEIADELKITTALSTPQAPLTDDQIYEMYSEPCSDNEMVAFARAIEAHHKIGVKP